MKLSGNKKNGRYASSNKQPQTPRTYSNQREQSMERGMERPPRKKKKTRRAGKILITLIVVIIALLAVLYVVYKIGVRPPEMVEKQPIPNAPGDGTPTEGTAPETPPGRKGTQYTFVILGMDDGNGNTDTMMVANFDVDGHKLSVVNIPRDTLVNVKWSTKKANSLYANGGMETVIGGLSDLGVHVDFYVKVELKAFAKLVDAIGGVEFDVPVDMYYPDPSQNLLIDLKAGLQHLDGKEALQLVRCRNAYANADIGRIETQQAFLKAAAEQILANQKKLDITELAGIFFNDVKTDLDLGELIWLGKEFYKTDAANISLETIPANYYDTVNKTSYCTINVNDWLKLLNEKINPFEEEIKAGDVSILTRDGSGSLYVTNGVWAGKTSWGSGGSSSGSDSPAASPSSKPSTAPSPSPSPSDSPEPSISPSDATESPSPSDAAPSPSGEDTSPDVSPTETGEGDTSPSPSESPSPSPSDIVPPSPGTTP